MRGQLGEQRNADGRVWGAMKPGRCGWVVDGEGEGARGGKRRAQHTQRRELGLSLGSGRARDQTDMNFRQRKLQDIDTNTNLSAGSNP